MQVRDVTAYNRHLHEYLCTQGKAGYGCRTQMRLEYLVADGYHFKLEFGPVLDKQYACAILGVPVPCPTPLEDFVPEHVRQRYEYDWPSLGVTRGSRAEGPYRNHGWKW